MKINEVLEGLKKFNRPCHNDDWLEVSPTGTLRWAHTKKEANLSMADSLATDWKFQEEKLTFSKDQILRAYNDAAAQAEGEADFKKIFAKELGYK